MVPVTPSWYVPFLLLPCDLATTEKKFILTLSPLVPCYIFQAFQKPGWTKDAGLAETNKGQKLKEGGEIARPIGGIRAVQDE